MKCPIQLLRAAVDVRTIGLLLLLLPFAISSAGAEPQLNNYSISWVGNTWSGKDEWVQDYIEQMTVQPDGTCYTDSEWDESGWNKASYKNGDRLANNSPPIDVTQAGGWSIQGTNVVGNGQTIVCERPTAIAIANDGKLVIAENGRRKQILFYNVGVSPPKLVKMFGEEGGIEAGTPGVVTPTKFWGLSGTGTDSNGNIYVALNEEGCMIRSFTSAGGLRWQVMAMHFVDCCDVDPLSDGNIVYGTSEKYRMDLSKSAPGSEFTLEDYTLDSYKYPNDPRGHTVKGGFKIAQGLEHGLTSCLIRYINGKKFMFINGMTCQWSMVYRFDGEIAVLSSFFSGKHRIFNYQPDFFWPPLIPADGHYIWRDVNGDADFQTNEYFKTVYPFTDLWWVDQEGGIWGGGGNQVFRRMPSGLDAKGNPIYDDAHVTTYIIPGVANATKLVYLPERKLMVVADGRDRLNLGRRIVVFEDWGLPTQRQLSVITPVGTRPNGLAVAGDYAFTTENGAGGGHSGRSILYVYRLRDGAYMGKIDPENVLGRTMVDIGYPLTAFRRSDGEYLIFVEEDARAKVIMYRWRPDGTDKSSANVPLEAVK